MKNWVVLVLATGCSGPYFEAATDAGLNPQPELPSIVTDPGTASEASSFAPTQPTVPVTSQPPVATSSSSVAASATAAPAATSSGTGAGGSGDAPDGGAPAPGGVAGTSSAPQEAGMAQMGQRSDAGPAPEPIPCTLGEADRGEARVRHSECPDATPFCQRHAVCGNDEWEPPECSQPGYDFVDVGDSHCTRLCNRYLVCADN